MVLRRLRQIGERGHSVAELLTVVAVVSIMAVLTIPFFLSYWQNETLRAGARELVTIVNGGRQLAIQNNTSVCVTGDGTRVRYLLNSCTGTVWTGPGTDASGYMNLSNAVQVTAAPNIVFTNLGAASTAGNFTVTNPANGKTLSVVVVASGRVTIQ